MTLHSGQPTCYRFGGFEVRPAQRSLLSDGHAVPLGGRAFDLLVALIERRHSVVSKDQLLDRIWPGLVVEEANVQVQVSALRKVIGAGAVATVARRGYQFVAKVECATEPSTDRGVHPHRGAAAVALRPWRSGFLNSFDLLRTSKARSETVNTAQTLKERAA